MILAADVVALTSPTLPMVSEKNPLVIVVAPSCSSKRRLPPVGAS